LLAQFTDSLLYKIYLFLKKLKRSYLDPARLLNKSIQRFLEDENDGHDQSDPQACLDEWYIRFHLQSSFITLGRFRSAGELDDEGQVTPVAN